MTRIRSWVGAGASLLAAVVALAPARATGQTDAVTTDPIRCWLSSSAGAVRVGEVFTVAVSCAVLENDGVQVQVDESRLAPATMQMAPFEIVGGDHAPDLGTPNRRFFQYEYRLRIVSPDAIGKDVKIPDLVLHYRINSTVSGNASLQGRDHTYLLPPLSVRVVSLVPFDAPDIRDTPGVSFREPERFTFRAGVLDITAYTLLAIGVLMTVVSTARLLRRRRARTPAPGRGLTDRIVLKTAADALDEAGRRAVAGGWDEVSIALALSATRVVAAAELGTATSQHVVRPDDPSNEGGLLVEGRGHRGKTTAVSAAVTPEEIGARLTRLPESAPADHRRALESMQEALTVFSAAQYAREVALDRDSLDRALESAKATLERLRRAVAWPKPEVRRWIGRSAESERLG